MAIEQDCPTGARGDRVETRLDRPVKRGMGLLEAPLEVVACGSRAPQPAMAGGPRWEDPEASGGAPRNQCWCGAQDGRRPDFVGCAVAVHRRARCSRDHGPVAGGDGAPRQPVDKRVFKRLKRGKAAQ